MNDVNVYLSRQRRRRITNQKNKLEAFSCSICPSAGVPSICKAENLAIILWDKERVHQDLVIVTNSCMHKMHYFDQWSLPPPCLPLHWQGPLHSNDISIVAKRLSVRHLILQYNLTMHCLQVCMSVMLWNAIITVGIPVTSLMIANATCTYYYTLYMYVHMLSSHARMVSMEHRKELARLRKWRQRERDCQETHCERPECISKYHELVRQVSEGQSTMIIDALPKALSSSILSSHRLQVC